MGGADWDPIAYDGVADPMFEWGMATLSGLALKGDERVMDAGCGSGRLTEELLKLLPQGKVVAVDFSPKMMEQTRARLAIFAPRIEFVEASLEDVQLPGTVDGVFSNAVFHWVPDHTRMFRTLHRALRPGGWLVSEFGGVGNLERTLQRAKDVTGMNPYRENIGEFEAGPHFEKVAETRERMEAAGFRVLIAELCQRVPRFEQQERYESFLETVVLRQPVAKLPAELRKSYLREVSRRTLAEEGAFSLDYVRLKVRAVA